MEKTRCLCCGAVIESGVLDTKLICGDCEGNISKGVLSKKFNYGQGIVRPFSRSHGYWR